MGISYENKWAWVRYDKFNTLLPIFIDHWQILKFEILFSATVNSWPLGSEDNKKPSALIGAETEGFSADLRSYDVKRDQSTDHI